jgi:alpha-tubulin suppressor-like RCC1 family protein
MARKGVQGFSEKSYYDNTRYLGVIATTDPLQEGYFKHLVNFDISDTGQSVQPREGFITTTLKDNLNIFSLSNQTIIYKDRNINQYVVYDFVSNKGYIVDVSAYNIEDKFLPVTHIIENINVNDLEDILLRNFDWVEEYLNIDAQGVYTNVITDIVTVIPETKVDYIIDEFSVSKALLKVKLTPPSILNAEPVQLVLEFFYRQDIITLNGVEFPGDTLNISVVNTLKHPTLIPSERSIAVSRSIIPENFQTLYTEETRPSGLVSNLGSFVYVYDDENNFVNNFIYRNTNYNIKPYFELNPAYYDLNNIETSGDKWAYKFEVFNTSIENLNTSALETVYSSPWMEYIDSTTKPEKVFSELSLKVNTFVLGNSDITLNHYRNAQYVIYVVPKIPNSNTSTTSSFQNGEYVIDYPDYPSGALLTTCTNLKTSWTNIINGIKNINTFKSNIELLNDALFYVVDLSSSTPNNIFNEKYDSLENFYRAYHTIDKLNDNNDGYENLFLTNTEVIKLIDDNQLNFKKRSIAFKLLPFVTNERITIQNRDDVSTIKFRWFFGSILDNVTTFTSDTLFNEQQLHRSSSSTPSYIDINKRRTQHTTNIFQNNYLNFNCASGANSDHKLIVTSNNKVYAFGRNASGQLGFGNTLNNYKTPTLNSNISGSIIGVATGIAHSYLITPSSLISMGSNVNGKLGINSTDSGTFSTPQETVLVGFLWPEFAGYTCTGISSGDNHGVILNSIGSIFTWGAGALGQIGNGSSTSTNISFIEITSQFTLSPGEVIVYITSGKNHNFALTNFGTLYGWGHNNNGQVGISGTSTVLTPTIINFIGLNTNEVIVNVSAGSNHSIALTNLGRVYVWGNNASKQLGDATAASSTNTPTLLSLNFLDIDENVNKVFTGSDQTYLITNKDNIYGFGKSWLGHKSSRTDTEVPVRINFPGLLTDEKILGFYNSEASTNFSTAKSSNLAFTNLNRIFVWGYDGNWGALGLNIDSTEADNQPAIPKTLTIPLDENEGIKNFEVKNNWTRIKQNTLSLINTNNVNSRFFDLRTWNLYEGSTDTNTFVPYINTFRQQFSLYIVKHNNFFVNNDYGFFKYNITDKTYSLETNLNILKNIGKTPIVINVDQTFVFPNQAPIYAETVNDFPINAAIGTRVQVIGTLGTGVGSFYTKQADGSWLLISSVTNPGVSFVKNQTYYGSNVTSRILYIWENESGTTGTLTVISPLPSSLMQFADLNDSGFFNKGLVVNFYMRPYQESELLNKTQTELETLEVIWGASSLIQTSQLNYGSDPLTVTYIQKELTKEPADIEASNDMFVFEDLHLVKWYSNSLYISEPGKYYWFKAPNKIDFPETIVKALQYKTIILVFTTQHLYAVYRVETTTTSINPETNQLEQNVTGIAWARQIVLYNLLVNKKYADVIQVFNQMVLFYSEDGQLFMIRPSTTIDDQTRFNVQFFNKSANDILLNYDVYINERLASYNKKNRITKDDVKIKALISINFIRIMYYVPGVIMYMLVYDVVNNRYYAYDTLSFTDVYDKLFVESGELYITEQNNKIYFSMAYVENNQRDNFVDMSFVNNFKKEPVNCLIDTGNLNLNNHLRKRFRDLHVVFKNLNATNLLFNLETTIDDIIAKPFYNTQLEVQDIGGVSYFVPITKENNNDLVELVDVNQISETATDVLKYSLTNQLFENNNLLLDFSEYSSSKLLTHRTSILGMGKIFRLKLQFVSKGKYKVQDFGIIYKERRV